MRTAPSNQDVQLPDPISNLLSELTELEDMPYYDSKTEAGIELFKAVKKKLLEIPNVQNREQMRKIAKPLALNMRKLRASFARVFDDRLTLKDSFIMSITFFIGSMVLHALFKWIYHKRKKEKVEPISLLTSPGTRDNSRFSGTHSSISRNTERSERTLESNKTGDDNGTQ